MVRGKAVFDVAALVDAETPESAIEAAKARQAPRAVAWRSSDAPSWDVDTLGDGGALVDLWVEVRE